MKKYLDFENLDFFLSNLDDRYCTKSEAGDISSSQVLNVTVNYPISTYTPMEPPTNKKTFYADIPCTQSKTTMNVRISPNDSVENVGLLTYAEPMDGFVRCYFSEQPTESYIVDSVELTSVTSVISEHLIKRVSDIPINEKLKFSSGKTFVLQAKNVNGHDPNSVTLVSEFIIENAEFGEALSYSESNIHKTIMPKYYNELSELEKKAIILHKFEVGALNEDLALSGELAYIKDQVESYFYAPDIGEIDVYVLSMLSNGDSELRYYGIYSDQGRDLGGLTRKKTFENGTLGDYFTTTMRKNDFFAKVVLVTESGNDMGTEADAYSQSDSPQYKTVTSGVVPFCDINSDTLVAKDTDGYWKIVEVPEYALSITEESLEVSVKSTVRLTVYSIVPAGATLEWSSDDEGVATVTDGVVTCRGIGKATITASIKKDNTTLISDSCTVIVGEVHI